jgi:hypothetical protein
MATEVPRDWRVTVIERARRQCEYCQKPDDPVSGTAVGRATDSSKSLLRWAEKEG